MNQGYSSKFPDYPPESREERMRILASIRDEDIDLSDMPEITDFSGAVRIGDKYWKMGERNRARTLAEEGAKAS